MSWPVPELLVPLVLVATAVVLVLAGKGARGIPRSPGGPRPLARWSPLAGIAGPGGSAGGSQWATGRDLRPLLGGGTPGRLTLGVAMGRQGRRSTKVLATEVTQSVIIMGPTQSGKTSCLAVPAILGWQGPVVAASVKTDLCRDTVAWRRRCGQVWCFDPAQVTGLPSAAWSPLPAAATWSGARRVAADLTEVAKSGGTTADGEFWYAMAAKLLAPLLYAAARGDKTMEDVVGWVDTQEVGQVMELLERAPEPQALSAAQAAWLREERQRSSVYTTAESVLEPFAEPGMAPSHPHGRSAGANAHGPGPHPAMIDAGALMAGNHTVYLCAPAHDQRRLVGLFTAVVKDVIQTAFTTASRQGGALEPPLLVVLDEAANIAPLAELDGLASTCAGHGVQLVTVFQDMAQISARYGARSATVVNNHRAKVFLSGISDPATLEHASQLVGEHHQLFPSFTRDPGGGRSTTYSPTPRPLLPGDALRRMAPGSGVLVYGALPPVRLGLCPWWEDPVLAARGARQTQARPVRGGNPGR